MIDKLNKLPLNIQQLFWLLEQ